MICEYVFWWFSAMVFHDFNNGFCWWLSIHLLLSICDHGFWWFSIMFLTICDHCFWWFVTLVFDDMWHWFLMIFDYGFWRFLTMLLCICWPCFYIHFPHTDGDFDQVFPYEQIGILTSAARWGQDDLSLAPLGSPWLPLAHVGSRLLPSLR
jgi:hypothetical protein